VFTSPHTPIAPPALADSVTAAFVGQLGSQNTKNVAYVDAAGTSVYLCTHALGGTWDIAYISEIATAPPGTPPGGKAPIQVANLVAYVSDRQHVIVTNTDGRIVDLWGSGGTWNWGRPNQPAQYPHPVAVGAPVNLPTGMSAFNSPNNTDSVVYIGSDGFIWELTLPQGSSEMPSAGPGYPPSIGLPWTANNASVMAGAQSGSLGYNPNYVPPAMNP